MREVLDLNRLWDAICNKEFSEEYKPQKVFANRDIQIMCILYENGSGYEVYERRSGEEWM